MVKGSWSFEILKQFWKNISVFKVLEFHIKKIMSVFLSVATMLLLSPFFSMKILPLYKPFWYSFAKLTLDVIGVHSLMFYIKPKLKIRSNEFLL
jgi:hypothetical protein